MNTEEFKEEVKKKLRKLDGTNLSAVKMLSNLTTEEINELGEMPPENKP